MFPQAFKWGVATSSYQIEGAYNQDKIPSIWDVFTNASNNIANNENGNIACDSYHLCSEDIQLMKRLNIKNYRFSISWTRVFKEDMTTINQPGLDFYINLVDELLRNDITPYITLFHWDLPQILEDNGGWLSNDTVLTFERYSTLVAKTFNNKVFSYITINEPQIIVNLGYKLGLHAPGKKLSNEDCFRISHNLLRAHGYAVKAIRAHSDSAVNIGISSTGNLVSPVENTANNIAVAYDTSFDLAQSELFFSHALFLDPIFLKSYPDSLPDNLKEIASTFNSNDWELISQPLDFLGVNIYNGKQVDSSGQYVPRYQGYPHTALGWPVSPEIMYYGIKQLYNRYHLPMVITENGQSCNDRIYTDGQVHDPDRIDFMYTYLRNLKVVIDEGIPVIGYFHWSFMDNFEWHTGYNERFGLIYVDYRTQARICKDSAYYFSKIITSNKLITPTYSMGLNDC